MGVRVVLLAGPSGSGKSRLAHGSGQFIFRLDDFYRDFDAQNLPRTEAGFIDWDHPLTWDAEGAAKALCELVETGQAQVPSYDISTSRKVGQRTVALGTQHCVIVEGIFATELLEPIVRLGLQRSCDFAQDDGGSAQADGLGQWDGLGLEPIPIWVDRSRLGNWWRRLQRDLREHRKPLKVLLVRGVQLFRAEPELRAAALAKGFKPTSYATVSALLRDS